MPNPRPSSGWHPTALVLLLALWLASVGNLPLWHALWRLHASGAVSLWPAAATCVMVLVGLTAGSLCLTMWSRWRRPLGVLLLLVSTLSSHFMLAYGVVIDPTMVANVAHTDLREARDLASPALGVAVLLGAVLPGIWWWRRPMRRVPALRLAWQQTGMAALAWSLAAAALWGGFQETAALMREHKALRYTVTPFNLIYGGLRLGVGNAAQAHTPRQVIGADAKLALPASGPAPLVVLVIGETARAANFGVAGYTRDTTPGLSRLAAAGQLTYFHQVQSCGTNTHTSLPCLFSHLGQAGIGREAGYDNLLDVLQRAGLAVVWLDNQSGCKGVCDRVPHDSTRATAETPGCAEGECHDEVLLDSLDQRLAALDPERRARGVVLVLHQMGSHGPAYHKRTPARFKPFGPECQSQTLSDCSPEELRNAYDNTVAYTDHVLGRTLQWLDARSDRFDTGMVYVSDHGESLGEAGLYLHGLPFALAPSQQTRVPMVSWLSPGLLARAGLDAACLGQRANRPVSHDHIFHSVLGLMDVVTEVRDEQLNLFIPCGQHNAVLKPGKKQPAAS